MNQSLRIIFMGTPDFAVPSLQALLDGPDEVVAVVCQPDRQKGRGKILSPPPIKILAEEHHIPVLQPTAIKSPELHQQLSRFCPDVFVVVAYGRILPPTLLTLAPLGAINVHGSLLPRYRGAAPIQWAVLNGDRETGITIMQMDEGMDTGDILLTTKVAIGEKETSGELFARLAVLGGPTLVTALELLKKGELSRHIQDHNQATHAPMLTKDQGHLDWTLPAPTLSNHIRGLDPWPSAYAFFNGKRYRFYDAEVVPRRAEEMPGTICCADNQGLLIATGKDYLRIHEIQPEGKKRMPVEACLRGTAFPPGSKFS